MADLKISQLTGATTPLAGTEVLPIVQSSTTKKVAVSDLTAGRAVSGTQFTASTGNFIPSTSGKGIDFSAVAGAAGSTSKVLSNYEEGTWTFSLHDAATGGNASPTTATGYYTRVGRLVVCGVSLVTNIDTTGMTAGNVLYFSLPFSTSLSGSGSAQLVRFVFGADAFATPTVNNASRGIFSISTNNNFGNTITVGNLTTGVSDIQYLTFTYQI